MCEQLLKVVTAAPYQFALDRIASGKASLVAWVGWFAAFRSLSYPNK